MKKIVVELDVREAIQNKEKPFHRIMAAIEGLQGNDVFILHAPFKPTPLLSTMDDKGFMYETEKLTHDHWVITFTKKGVEYN